MRLCSKCRENKPLSEFYPKRRKYSPDGWNSICIPCAKERAKAWVAENREQHARNTLRWAKANLDKHYASISKWAKENRATRRAAEAAWKLRNPGKRASFFAKRRALKVRATPMWANEFFISEAYHLAALRTKVTGFPWHVDHIVPLMSKIVCGLHVENNLQVIPGHVNASKSNRHWPEMPEPVAEVRAL